MNTEFFLPQDRSYLLKLFFVFLGILIASVILGTLIQLVYFFLVGIDPTQLFTGDAYKNHLKVALLTTQLFTFLLPSLIFAWMVFKRNLWTFFRITSPLNFNWLWVAVAMLFFLLPLIQFTYELNQSLPLPDWMTRMEQDAATTLETIIRMDHAGDLMINLLLIGLLPALGEEFIFRGIIQQFSYRLFNNRNLGVFLTAFIFSAIHFQFEGFIPRFILGLYLGYLFLWTNNLLVPIVAHLFNNGFMVLLSYFNPELISNIDETPVPDLPWYGLLISTLCIFPLIVYFRNINRGASSPDKPAL